MSCVRNVYLVVFLIFNDNRNNRCRFSFTRSNIGDLLGIFTQKSKMDFYALSYAANTKTLPYARVRDIVLSLKTHRPSCLSIIAILKNSDF